MTGTILMDNTYSDAEYVEGVLRHDHVLERALHYLCKKYFDENYQRVFFVGDEYKDDIFQEAFIQLWENIGNGKIYVENRQIYGRNGMPLSGKLTSYFMGIARMKFLEWVRFQEREINTIEDPLQRENLLLELQQGMQNDNGREMMLDIISYCISRLPKRCRQILTMFYYEEKTLDDIMKELPSFESKDALKTAKYKCMENLRKTVKTIYQRCLNE